MEADVPLTATDHGDAPISRDPPRECLDADAEELRGLKFREELVVIGRKRWGPDSGRGRAPRHLSSSVRLEYVLRALKAVRTAR